jgi:hypothetical protein
MWRSLIYYVISFMMLYDTIYDTIYDVKHTYALSTSNN